MFWINLELCESVELGLRSELQESQSYIERPWLQKPNNNKLSLPDLGR